jgi:hypothetical protein
MATTPVVCDRRKVELNSLAEFTLKPAESVSKPVEFVPTLKSLDDQKFEVEMKCKSGQIITLSTFDDFKSLFKDLLQDFITPIFAVASHYLQYKYESTLTIRQPNLQSQKLDYENLHTALKTYNQKKLTKFSLFTLLYDHCNSCLLTYINTILLTFLDENSVCFPSTLDYPEKCQPMISINKNFYARISYDFIIREIKVIYSGIYSCLDPRYRPNRDELYDLKSKISDIWSENVHTKYTILLRS